MSRKSRRSELIVELSDIEIALLARLLDDLDLMASQPPGDDPVDQRLYVAGYADPDAAADFRELTEVSLQQDRRDRYGQCRAELPRERGQLVMAADVAQRWLMVVNDMRLALGTRLGVTAEGFDEPGPDSADADPDVDARAAARSAYYWLTQFQDELLTSVMN